MQDSTAVAFSAKDWIGNL